MNNYEPVIGLEIHVQLKTKSKMFCSSPNNPDEAAPNTNICEVCSGQPGSLPVANREAVKKAIMVGLALGCEIPAQSKFDRKNYFYPDLPKGYQISQYDQPLCGRGEVEILTPLPNPPHKGEGSGEGNPRSHSSPLVGEARWGAKRKIRITRAHLEEDAGKLIHEAGATLVDLNRAGVPLLEIVTEPDFRTPGEAKKFLQDLRNTVRYLGVSDADMEKGHLRCDANVSVRKAGQPELPSYKVEIKNMNSFKAVEAGLNHEIKRQQEALDTGEQLKHETRGWDDVKQITVEQRTKEEAHDYRYFPEPDLPLMHFDKSFIEEIRSSLPELPEAKLQRFTAEFGLSEKDAKVLIADRNLAGYFEEVVSELQEWLKSDVIASDSEAIPRHNEIAAAQSTGPRNDIHGLAKAASNWIFGDFQALLKTADITPMDAKIIPENLAELIKMIERGEVSGAAGKKILAIMFERGGDPSNIAADQGLGQISDEGAIVEVVDKVLAANASVVTDYKAGKKQALGFLVGKVMAEMHGKANPGMVSKILSAKLA